MRDPVRNRERLEHIKDAIERIQDNIKTVSLDNLSSNVLAFYEAIIYTTFLQKTANLP